MTCLDPATNFCGTWPGYAGRGCRGDDCRDAWAQYQRDRKALIAAGDPDRPDAPLWRWDDKAACVGHDWRHWFPTGNHPDWRYARAICAACPVKAECLAQALHDEWKQGTTSRFGMSGGLTPTERNRKEKEHRS